MKHAIPLFPTLSGFHVSLSQFFSFSLILSRPIPIYIRRFRGELEIGNSLRHVSARVREEGAYMPPTTP